MLARNLPGIASRMRQNVSCVIGKRGTFQNASKMRGTPLGEIDDRQITHLICVRLKHLLYDFLGGVLGLLPVVFLV